MRTILKPFFIALLAACARAVVNKYNPIVVMVTGSVGKTSTRDAVAAALSEKFYLRKSEKSYNNEFGLPLTILGVDTPRSNPAKWIQLFAEALSLLIFPNHYPKLLVLEVGADQPGDLAKILRIAQPDAVVVTLLPAVPVHVEAYATPAAVREEEFTPALALQPGSPLIISADDEYAVKHALRVPQAVLHTFGTAKEAQVRIVDMDVWLENDLPEGMEATLEIQGTRHTLRVPHAFGRSQLFAPAAAVATALGLGMTVQQALKGLSHYEVPSGRGRIFKGIKNTVILDDSYNASPVAVEAALKSLSLLPKKGRKVAILGDMLELGRYSVAEHMRIGHIAKDSVDLLITIGQRAHAMGEAAKADGMPDDMVYHFGNSIEGAPLIADLLKEGDVILVKGSQTGIRLERIVKHLLANPDDSKYLVRQDAAWQKKR